MIKASTLVLGTSLLAVLAVPLAARADHNDDKALAFIVGATVGHVLTDNDIRVRHVHRRYPDHRSRDYRWRHRHKAFHRELNREHRRFHKYGGYDHDRRHRRDDRHHRRHDRRDHRREHRDGRWHH